MSMPSSRPLSFPFVTGPFESDFKTLRSGPRGWISDYVEWTDRVWEAGVTHMRLSVEAHALRVQVEELKAKAVEANAEADGRSERLRVLDEQVGTRRGEVASAEAKLASVRATLKDLETELTTARGAHDEAVRDRDVVLQGLAAAQRDLDRVGAERDRAALDLEGSEGALRTAREERELALAETREAREGIEGRERDLARRDREVFALEAAAEKRATDAAVGLQKARADAAALIRAAEEEVQKGKLVWEGEQTARVAADEAHSAALRQSDAERASTLTRRAAELDDLEAGLEADKALIADIVARRVAHDTGKVTEQLADAKADLLETRKVADRLRKEKSRLDALLVAYKGRDLVAIDEELTRLRDDVARLTADLETRLSREEADALRGLRKKQRAWELERDRLVSRIATLEAKEEEWTIDVADVSRLKGTAEKWETLYNQTRADLNHLCERANAGNLAASPFPRMLALDDHEDLVGEPENAVRTAVGLPSILDEVGRRLASPRRSKVDPRKEGLEYDRTTLQRYLAGMAMSRWILLEGDPGTGKTTLAVEFAQALGAGVGVVAVQAGWRDRSDLVGHYNTFERQFHETDFLEHLYRAQTPRYKDLPYVIVLDEVNVSRPEYYFADFLSLLELRAAGKTVSPLPLLSKPLTDDGEPLPGGAGTLANRLPKALVTGGTHFALPPNVWFVGTANDDESTLTPAPRTYDRAHVQNLRQAVAPVTAGKPDLAPQPYTLKVLEDGFSKAEGTYRDEVTRAKDLLEAMRAPLIDAKLRWTNRLNRQLERYVPTYLALGQAKARDQDFGDAVDHLIATKVLLRLRGDYNRPAEMVSQLLSDLEVTAELEGVDIPESLAFLEGEVRARENR